MTTAEKRAELEEKGEPWPVCDCHGAEKGWHKDQREARGGYWRCLVRRRATISKYQASPKGKTSVARAKAKYRASLKSSLTERRRVLLAQRERIILKLEELNGLHQG